jgi:beta-glucosidase
MDLEAPWVFAYGDALLGLVRRGEVPGALVEQAARRVLRAKFLAGLFENPFADEGRAAREVGRPEARALARRVARESMVLLKNEGGLLPLARGARRIAVIGPNADEAQLGDYCKPKPTDVTPLAGIRAAAGKRVEVRHAKGCGLFDLSRGGFREATKAARWADVAIVVVGESSLHFGGVGWGIEGKPALGGEGSDSHDVALPGAQEDLVRAVHATGTPTVVVLVNGRPMALPWIAEHVPAVVEAWYPGEQGGHALADLLFGKANPSGKLPASFPRSAGHLPCCYDRKPSAGGYYRKPGAPGKPGRDYVFSAPSPLWPFGHGLSYTRFAYSGLAVSPRRLRAGGKARVSVRVRNAGRRAGAEVVQLYLRDAVSTVTTPVRRLRRFAKVFLRPGQSRRVRFELGRADMELLDAAMRRVVEPGAFEVEVGPLKAGFEVYG